MAQMWKIGTFCLAMIARATDVGGMRKHELTKTAFEFHHSIYLFNVQLKGRILAENSNLQGSLY